MSANNNDVMLIGGALVALYMMMQRPSRRMTYPPGYYPGGVSTMPGSAGVGWQQFGQNVLSGFLREAASGIQNSSTGYTPSLWNQSQQETDYYQSGTVQDSVDSYMY